MQDKNASRGLFESLTNFAGTLLVIAHTRLNLLSVDLEEELAHFFSLLVSTLVAMFCLGIGVVLAVIMLVVLFWDAHRLLSLAGLAGFFLMVGVAAWVFAFHKAKTKPRLFAASLAELGKDRQQVMSRHE
jgi:uncharacterized membrane protein YqjE